MATWLFCVSMYVRATSDYTDGVFREVQSDEPSQDDLIGEINLLHSDMKDLIGFMMDQAKRNGDTAGYDYLEKLGKGRFDISSI